MIVVLTVMSGMDPHMISGNLGWVLVKSWLGSVEVSFIRLWVSHGRCIDVIFFRPMGHYVRDITLFYQTLHLFYQIVAICVF
jgi:hypothetical protein